jgi:hypothetical protein
MQQLLISHRRSRTPAPGSFQAGTISLIDTRDVVVAAAVLTGSGHEEGLR